MALDGITIAALCAELNNSISGGRITKIAQPEADELLFTIKMPTGNLKLLISASATLPFCYLTDESIQSPMTAPNFCMLLRKYISSGRITKVTQPSLERVLDFHIEHLNEMGDLCSKILTVELMGKHSNIIFREPDGKIIDAIKHISAAVSSVREVLPGRDYFIPGSSDKLDPLNLDKQEFIDILRQKPMPLYKGLYSTLTGFSPIMAEEICYRAGMDSDRSATDITEDEALHIFNNVSWLIEDIKESKFTPAIISEGCGAPIDFAVVDITQYSGATSSSGKSPSEGSLSVDIKSHTITAGIEEYSSVSAVLREFYQRKNEYTRIRQKSYDLRKIVTTYLERDVKKLDLQKKQLADTDKMDTYRIYGELLTAYSHQVISGSKSYTCINYYDGNEIRIPLDETLSATANAQKYYDRYGKCKRTKEAVTIQVAETEAEIMHLNSILASLNIAQGEDDLLQIREELCDCGYIKKHAQKGKKTHSKSQPFHYISSDGFDIFVGRNNYQNDELTFKVANSGDWWFHAKKIPGSHVILRTGGREVPDKAFEEAASLAAYYSAATSEGLTDGKVEVDYVMRKEVKKPSGAKPGFVVYYTNYSLMATPDISSLTLA